MRCNEENGFLVIKEMGTMMRKTMSGSNVAHSDFGELEDMSGVVMIVVCSSMFWMVTIDGFVDCRIYFVGI